MRETSASNGAAYFASAPAALSAAVPLRPRQDDYAWTHSAPVDWFFVVLTVVVVPVAIVRWTRRLRALLRARHEHLREA